MEETTNAPKLPAFEEGEMKKLSLGFTQAPDGKIEIAMASMGMHDDLNEMAVFLAFALEKLLEA